MVDDNATNQAPVTTDSKEQTVVSKPEYVQDKFWDVDRKEVNLEKLEPSRCFLVFILKAYHVAKFLLQSEI